MADLYFRCGNRSEAVSLEESAREFAEKHDMTVEHVIFDRQAGRTGILNMYADCAAHREPTTLIVRNYACLGSTEIQRLAMYKKLLRNGLDVVFASGGPVEDDRRLILRAIKSYYCCGDEWQTRYDGFSRAERNRKEPANGAKYAMPVPFGYRMENGAPIIEPAEAAVVRNVFLMYSRGAGAIEIAREANALLADIRAAAGERQSETKPLTRHNIYSMVENVRYFGREEREGFMPYPAIVPNYLRLYAERMNRRRKAKPEAGHEFMFTHITPVGLGAVLQTVNIASPYKPEIRLCCENGTAIIDAGEFENAIYTALWKHLKYGNEKMAAAVNDYAEKSRTAAETVLEDLDCKLEVVRDEINYIGEHGWNGFILPHLNRANLFDSFKTSWDELREEQACARLECELFNVTWMQISDFFDHAADLPRQCAEEIRFFSAVFLKDIEVTEEKITIKMLGKEWGETSLSAGGMVKFVRNEHENPNAEPIGGATGGAQKPAHGE